MSEQLALLPEYLFAHVRLTLAALLTGLAISVPLGVFVSRRRWLEQPVLGVAGVIQTIPSLALLAGMVPILAAARVRSIGFLPAFLGLVLYSLLPILRNTVAGIGSVDPAYIEAARGVGMTPRQTLTRVELPLALPVIVAGARTATVWTVGAATLSTPVGATSLGNYIFSGLQTRNYVSVLVGCVASAGLALALDAIVKVFAAAVEQRRRTFLMVGGASVALACGAMLLTLARGGAEVGQVRIGAKTFTEQYILAEVLRDAIEESTTLRTHVSQSLGSSVVFDALRSGEIDAYVDYSGTVWATVMKRDTASADRATVLEEVGRHLQDEHGIVLVGALGFENAYALAMPRARAEELAAPTISELSRRAGRLTMGGDYEFFARPEWRAIESTYDLRPAKRRTMDASLMYDAAANGDVDFISAFSTDGRVKAFDLVILRDDEAAIPPYDAIILASARLAAEHPEAIEALRSLTGTIDGDTMRAMNSSVDRDGESPREVARRLSARARTRDRPRGAAPSAPPATPPDAPTRRAE